MGNATLFLANGAEVTPLAIFNDGNSYIIEDDGCYQILNFCDGVLKPATHIFAEALAELKKLPSNPYHTRLGYDVTKEENLDEN